MNARSTLRALGAGRLALALWHQPVGRLRDCVRAGGPWEIRRTERGRAAMEAAAAHLPPLAGGTGTPLTPHLLTGRRFWYQTAFCLHTLARHTGRPLAPVLYDDGSLTAELSAHLRRLVPHARIVTLAETAQRLDTLLPRAQFPTLRHLWATYPNIRKLIDPHLGAHGWKLVIDSDLLFFRAPDFLVAWLDRPARPLHAVDVMRSYGYSDALLARLAPAPLADRLNVGLCGLNSDELDWPAIERLCRALREAEGHNYYLEQALVAVLLAGRDCAVAPAADYVTLPTPPEALACRAVMHHYVAHSKRWYFQHNWRRTLPDFSAAA